MRIVLRGNQRAQLALVAWRERDGKIQLSTAVRAPKDAGAAQLRSDGPMNSGTGGDDARVKSGGLRAVEGRKSTSEDDDRDEATDTDTQNR